MRGPSQRVEWSVRVNKQDELDLLVWAENLGKLLLPGWQDQKYNIVPEEKRGKERTFIKGLLCADHIT